MPQSIAHAEEIETGIRKRNRLGPAFAQINTGGHLGVLKHACARIDANDKTRGANYLCGLACNHAGTNTNIKYPHARSKTSPRESLAAIPGPAAKGEQSLDSIVVRRRAIKDGTEKNNPLVLVSVIVR